MTETREIDLDLIDVDPKNARRTKTPAADRELVESIKRLGVLQPVTVRKTGDRFQLVMGERRTRCARLAGLKTISAQVREMTDEVADAAGLTENLHRADLTGTDLARKLAEMLASDSWTIASIASAIGKTPRFVARRENLRNLSAKWRKSLKKTPQDLRVLEAVALLAVKDQDQLWNRWGRQTVRQVDAFEAEVATRCRNLRTAPWKIEDAELVPKAGACLGCTKHSLAKPDLFGTADTKKPIEEREAECLDSPCWTEKLTAWRDQRLAAAREKHGRELGYIHGESWSRDTVDLVDPEGLEFTDRWSLNPARKNAAGARPYFVVSGSGVGKVVYRTGRRSSTSTKKAAKKVAPGTKADLDLKLKRLAARRMALFVDKVRAALMTLPETKLPPAWSKMGLGAVRLRVLQLVAAYGCDSVMPESRIGEPDEGKVTAEALFVSAILQDGVAAQLKRWNPSALPDEEKAARKASVEFLGEARTREIDGEVLAALPESKVIVALRKRLANPKAAKKRTTKKAPAKKKAAKKKAAKRPARKKVTA